MDYHVNTDLTLFTLSFLLCQELQLLTEGQKRSVMPSRTKPIDPLCAAYHGSTSDGAGQKASPPAEEEEEADDEEEESISALSENNEATVGGAPKADASAALAAVLAFDWRAHCASAGC